MLTLDECRKVLGPDCKLSDSELEVVRGQLYGLADIAIAAFIEQRDRNRMNRRKTESPQVEGPEQAKP